ncbi:tripartite tricarboxylate transporter TctB family protein [Defluviitalea phaphyphila]|uniref:tripartite tricarboxylate transporter TctB family protein n=1 Tax=Defluviitalea phaphyphila TaxID=1473580 RepID=UPI0007312E4A|nr:tripartite tricarboxylate transporter TctB family protein [Defluviitalea phaphyphila]
MVNFKKLSVDIIISISIFLILIAFALNFGGMPAEAKGYPIFLITCSAILNLFYLYRSIKNYKKNENKTIKKDISKFYKKIFIYIIMIGIYIFVIDKIGYIISTILFIIISLLFLKVRNKVVLILLPIITTALMYFLFTKFLMVILPSGIWLF